MCKLQNPRQTLSLALAHTTLYRSICFPWKWASWGQQSFGGSVSCSWASRLLNSNGLYVKESCSHGRILVAYLSLCSCYCCRHRYTKQPQTANTTSAIISHYRYYILVHLLHCSTCIVSSRGRSLQSTDTVRTKCDPLHGAAVAVSVYPNDEESQNGTSWDEPAGGWQCTPHFPIRIQPLPRGWQTRSNAKTRYEIQVGRVITTQLKTIYVVDSMVIGSNTMYYVRR